MKRVLFVGSCLLAVVLPVSARSDAPHKKTIIYLQKLQSDDGGFRASAAAKESDLPATTTAFRVLKYFAAAPRDKDACAAFVRKCFDKERGGFAARPGGAAAYRPTAVGIMAVVDMRMPTEPYVDAVIEYLDTHSKTFEEVRLTAASFESLGKRAPHADTWIKQIAKLRKTDGTYGEGGGVARDTGGAVCAVLRLGGKVEQRDNVLNALNAGQRKDGGFGKAEAPSDLATSYRVMRAFHMLKTQPRQADRLREFIARCRNDDGGYGVAPGQASGVSGCYYAGIILHWLDEK